MCGRLNTFRPGNRASVAFIKSISWLSPAPRTTIALSATLPAACWSAYQLSSTHAIIGHAICGKPGTK